MWTSPLDPDGTTTPWIRWCRTERHDRTLSTLTILRPDPADRVLVIDSDDDVQAMDLVYGRGDPQIMLRTSAWRSQRDWEDLTTKRVFDWAAVAADFDAVHITNGGLHGGGGAIPRLKWDVATVWFTRAAFHIHDVIAIPATPIGRPLWASPRDRGRLPGRRVINLRTARERPPPTFLLDPG